MTTPGTAPLTALPTDDAPWAAPVAGEALDATVEIPGSKSLTNRLLVLAALADGPGVLRGALRSRDSDLMVAALRALGVRVDVDGPDAALAVGRERVPLADVDAAHLRAVREGEAGVDAGAPVLGGGWSVPKGRAGLPLKLSDGRTVLVPTRDPDALSAAILAAAPDAADGSSGSQGTLDR